MPNSLLTILRRVPFLRDLPDDVLAAVAERGNLRRVRRGQTLFAEGDACPGLHVVAAGRVKICKFDGRGRELTLGIADRGEVVGAPACFDGGNCPYDAIVYGDESAVIFHIAPSHFLSLLTAHPSIAVGAVRFVAIQNRRLIEMLKAQMLHSVRTRFAAYLLHAAGGSETFVLPDSNAGIAAHLGTVREVVSRTLHQFADLGYILLQGRVVTVVAPELLRQAASDVVSLRS